MGDFFWLYRDGSLDRQSSRKNIAADIKQMKTSFDEDKKVKKKKRQLSRENYVYEKWMWFGSGFYGLTALWTFVVVEVSQFFSFIFDFPGADALFGGGLLSFVIEFSINQLGNIITAFIWFTFWLDGDSILICFLVTYFGYWCGIELAKQGLEFPLDDFRKRIIPASREDD